MELRLPWQGRAQSKVGQHSRPVQLCGTCTVGAAAAICLAGPTSPKGRQLDGTRGACGVVLSNRVIDGTPEVHLASSDAGNKRKNNKKKHCGRLFIWQGLQWSASSEASTVPDQIRFMLPRAGS